MTLLDQCLRKYKITCNNIVTSREHILLCWIITWHVYDGWLNSYKLYKKKITFETSLILKLIYCSHMYRALEPVLLKFEVCRLGQQKIKKCKIYLIMTEILCNVFIFTSISKKLNPFCILHKIKTSFNVSSVRFTTTHIYHPLIKDIKQKYIYYVTIRCYQ